LNTYPFETPSGNNPQLSSNPHLQTIIASQIAAAPNQRITFAEYMDLALYHPEQGYYATGAVNIGSEGDFFTSPHLGRDFGELLAEQFAQMWDILERPTPFTLVEMGAGQGLLAADVLHYLHRQYPDCFNALEYIIVEKAPGLKEQQQQLLQRLKLPIKQLSLRWLSLEEIPENSITGCCFSNELVDAFPVHQVIKEGGQLGEIYVTTAEGVRSQESGVRNQESGIRSQESGVRGQESGVGNQESVFQPLQADNNPKSKIQNPKSSDAASNEINFVEVMDTPSTPKLKEYFDFIGIDLMSDAYPEGYRSEVNLAALDWLSSIAKRLQRGFLLTIDYGYSADRYYLPVRHQGTLQCYYHHRHHDDPYLYVGYQDITAHVNFTGLERQGEVCGLHKVGFTQQGLFLMALGLGDRIAALSSADNARGQEIAGARDLVAIMQRRQTLHQLMDPMGLGGFGVLVQSKGLTAEQENRPLKGLSVPPML
jgi:SAM-dependent MidA family methyltransferase